MTRTGIFNRKDDRLTDPGGASTPIDLSKATYREILERARDRQLELTAENLNRLAQVYDRAAESIIAKVAALPDERIGTAWVQAQLNLYQQIVSELDGLKRDFAGVLDLSLLSNAQQVADREKEVERFVEAAPDPRLVANQAKKFTLTSGVEYTVQFGTIAKDAVTRTATRYYGDGLKLSDRLYSLDKQMRQTIEDTILQGLTTGQSARNMAKEMERVLLQAGAANPRHRASVIARTEISNAYREASREAVMRGGQMKPYVQALGWRLSASHPAPDVCDVYAHDDTGLGSGNYLPNDYPAGSHPNCLCYSVACLVALPDEQFVTLAPDVQAVPQSQIAYYARQGDPIAARALAARGGI